jgi:tetratricopeptide (TPR) repeat protein
VTGEPEVLVTQEYKFINIERVRISVIFISLCIFLNLASFGQNKIQQNSNQDSEKDPGFLYAFTEASRLLLFEDYGRALSLFNECLKYEPGSAAVHYQLAQIYIKAGDFASARNFSRNAYLIDPDNVWYAMQLASIYQAGRMEDSAILVYKSLLKGSKEDLNILFKIASLYEQEGKYKDALQYLDNIEKEAGVTKEVCISKSRIYDKGGKKQKALNELRRCLSGTDQDYIVLGIIAEFYRTHNQPDSAMHYYELIERDHRDDANVMFSYGEFLLEQGQVNKAKNVYIDIYGNDDIDENVKISYLYGAIQDEKLYTLVSPVLDTVVNTMYRQSRDSIRIISLYSDIKYRGGKYDDAARALKRIIIIDDKNYSAWEQLLFCENALSRKDSVKYYGEIAIARFPERPLPYLVLGSVQYEEKVYSKAVVTLKTGEVFAGGDRLKVEFYSLLAECYGKIGHLDMSDDYYMRSLKIDSLNVVVLNNYSYSLAVRGDNISKAIAMSKYTIEKEPYNSTYLDTYAWVMYQSNNFSEAEKYIRKAIQYGGSTNAEILSHFGDILAKRGKMRDAVAAWNEALKYGDGELESSLRLKIENSNK